MRGTDVRVRGLLVVERELAYPHDFLVHARILLRVQQWGALEVLDVA